MKSRETELGFLYLFFDIIILNIAILLMGLLSFNVSLPGIRETGLYFLHGNLSVILTYLVFTKSNLYLSDSFRTRIGRITKQTFIFLVILLLISFLLIQHHYTRWFLFGYTALFFAGKLLFYWLLYKYLKIKRQKGINTKRALIIGLNDSSRVFRTIIRSNFIMGYQFIGFVDDKATDSPDLLGHPDDLDSLIDQHNIHMVFVMISIFSGENRLLEYLKICNLKGVHVRFISENQHLLNTKIDKDTAESLVVINPQEIPFDQLKWRIYKRMFDLAFSTLCILLIFTWLFPIVILMIKLSSKGPIFFRQKRTGANNEIFRCIKFRSMRVNDNADFVQATENDSRITRLGHFMRKTHLDELPQFFNVFMGQMSVVGPRPHMLKHTALYSGLIKHYLVRHYMKPGVTGWAQVSGYCGETDELWKMEKRVEYDMYYIEHWAFAWDIKIIWDSVFGNKNSKELSEDAQPDRCIRTVENGI